jgi:ketosteroid isomerase-like protein
VRKKLIFVAFVIAATQTQAQTSVSSNEDEVRKRSAIWSTAFAQRDIPALTSLFSEDAQIATAGIKLKNRAECAQFFEALFKKRPDVSWLNRPTKIEVNLVWKVAYETGDWKEAWTEDDGRAEIQGKYFAMWLLNLNEGVWYLHAAIFTPQRCIGESKYCGPREPSVKR